MTSIYAGLLIVIAIGLGIMAKNHEKKPTIPHRPLPPISQGVAPAPSPADSLTETPTPTLPPKPVPEPVPAPAPVAKSEPTPAPAPVPKPAPAPAPVQPPKPEIHTLTPSIYYISKFQLEDQTCAPEQKKNLMGTKGQVLFQVCQTAYWSCVMEGTCEIEADGVSHLLNFGGRTPEGIIKFFEIQEDGCPYGVGVRTICLDPFYTLAADPQFHKPGEVLFIEKVRGTVLPNGQIHNGYFIVRDAGKKILGPHRFDFFTGDIHYRDPANPFSKIGLASTKGKFAYKRVSKEVADRVRKSRGFPGTTYE